MNSKTSTWLWTTSVTAVTGAASLYVAVKNAALRHLSAQGAFNEAQNERADALNTVTRQTQEATAHSAAADMSNSASYVEKVNQRYMARKQAIIKRQHADSFSGAWDILSTKEKTGALEFSAVTSIVAGGLTYAVKNASKAPRKSGGRGDGDSGSGCGYVNSYASDGGHGHGGHGCGHGCGHSCSSSCGGH